jgi:hypothetical protein
MIIRPVCSREFVALPNIILNDDENSIETRGMIAWCLSKPKSWQIRPKAMARALSKEGKPLGHTKLKRMLQEAMASGYLARSAEQTHKANGDFESYVYVIGMPEDVAAAVAQSAVTFLAHDRFAHTQNARTQNARTQNGPRREKRQKEETQNLKINDDDKYHPLPLPAPAEAPLAADDGYTAFGRNALAHGMQFVFENSQPFFAWLEVRGQDGMPLIDVVLIQGKRRRGVWLPSLYPPDRSSA